ncbi:MAG: hypothetical protein EP329_25615 [Deltaproteobacteria bacterium]|nr:MAG: hypothetical protein EP329_25615 [Deltaproteobacteria bacterium]
MSRRVVVLLGLFAFAGGCAADPTAAPFATGGVEVQVAPLTLDGVTNARYALTVTNGAGGTGDVVWEKTVESLQYGSGSGSLSYVGTCDADTGVNTVSVELLALYDAGGEVAAAVYQNPGVLSLDVDCVADQDVRVTFDITIARQAQQGFFDVAVELDDLFCSAKLDCQDDAGGDLDLLHDASGARNMTAVLGFACTGGLTGDTYLYMDDPVITCTDGSNNVVTTTVDASGLGNLDLTQAPSANPGGYLFAAAVYRGDEDLFGKSYWNIGFGLDDTRFATLGSCVLTGRATAASEAWPQEPSGFPVPTDRVYPVIDWSVPLSDATGRVCTSHEVNVTDSGVATHYVGHLSGGNLFTWGPQVYLDHRYDRTAGVSGPAGFAPVFPSTGLMLYVDAAVDPSGTSLDPTGDVPDDMTAQYVDADPKYWTSDPTGAHGGTTGRFLWSADARWSSPSYTVCGWFYKRADARQIAWSQYVPTASKKFNWAFDPSGNYHNNMIASGGVNYTGGPWFDLNAWHFQVLRYENNGQLTITVDGQPWAALLYDYPAGQGSVALDVTLLGRNDDYAPERFDGHVAQAWYYDRALTDQELVDLYQSTKARYGVDRVFNPSPTATVTTTPVYPSDHLMLYVDAAVNTTAQSLDATGDVPDTMNATWRDRGPKYWESTPAVSSLIRWNADARWAGPSYTLCGWFYKRSDGRMGMWSQYTPTGSRKFNWMGDPNREYHNNMLSAAADYNGGPWYDLNAWHFHALTYQDQGQFKISVDGNPNAVAVTSYATPNSTVASSVALLARNDDYSPERWDGFVSQAWYYDRVLTDQELVDLYESTKARYFVDRVYSPAAP